MAASAILTPALRREQRHPVPPNERPVEYRYALDALIQSAASSILDVGPGTSPFPALLTRCGYDVTAIDQIDSYWSGDFFNRHSIVERGDITQAQAHQYDAVLCISTLEHIPDHRAAVRGMFSAARPGSIVVITVPYNEDGSYCPNAYELPNAGYRANNYVAQIFNREILNEWISENDAELVHQEVYEAFTGERWTEGKRILPPRQTTTAEPHQLTCVTLRAR